jgi:hypothetical protein
MNLASCSEEIDKSNRYTFTGETIADFILNREERFSKMITILKQADMMGLLSTYGTYTFFLPGDSAIDTYLREQFEAAKREEEEAKQAKLEAEKQKRYDEVVEAYERFAKLKAAYVDDYGYFYAKHTIWF